MRSILMGDIDSKIASIKNPVYREMLEKCLVKDANKRVKDAQELLNVKVKIKENKLVVEKKIIKEKEDVKALQSKQNTISKAIIDKTDNSITQSNKGFKMLLVFLSIVIGLIWIIFDVKGKNKETKTGGDTVIVADLSKVTKTTESDRLVTFEKNGKVGLKKINGEVIVQPIYRFISKFSEGLAVVEIDNKSPINKRGFIDSTGKVAIPLIYNYACMFSEGLASVFDGKKSYFIDHKGNKIIDLNFDVIPSSFKEGLAGVKINDKCGYINNKGNIIIPCMYDYADNFSEGLASVKIENKKLAIDKNNNVVFYFQPNDDIFHGFSEGLGSLERNGMWGFIDKTGKEVIPFIYKLAGGFSEGLACVLKNGKLGFVDKTGTLVIPLIYDQFGNGTDSFLNGFAEVSKNGKLLLIDKNGKEYPISK